jgi:hypothetical protein
MKLSDQLRALKSAQGELGALVLAAVDLAYQPSLMPSARRSRTLLMPRPSRTGSTRLSLPQCWTSPRMTHRPD